MKEQISAFMDNELSVDEAQRLIKSIKNDPTLSASWDAYHQVGDALRNIEPLSEGFHKRFSERLAQEPTILAPQRERLETPAKRFPFSIAASVAALGLVGFLSLQIARVNMLEAPAQVAAASSPRVDAPQLASAQAVPKKQVTQLASATSHKPAQVKFARATSNAYLLAHQEFSPSYAPAYVRVVSASAETDQ